MVDENILAGFTPEQADADIAARQAKVDALEETLAVARDNLAAAKTERKHLEDPPAPANGAGTRAGAGAAEASGKAGSR